MEEVIDYAHATSSPEELAIHFLLRHAACRMALAGQTRDETGPRALAGSQPDASVPPQAVVDSPRSSAPMPGSSAPAAKVTEGDSYTARFSRAYAAARHMPSSAQAPRSANRAA